MQVSGPQSLDLSRFIQRHPQLTSSNAGGLPTDVTGSASLPVEPSGSSVNPQLADSVVFGSVSLDLSIARSESLSTYASVRDSNGYASLRQDLSRSFEAELNIGFSFAAAVPGGAEKLSQLDPAMFAEWQKTASDLMSLNPQDYNEFVTATDNLFNEIEKALGMGSTGLDYAADFFKDKVGGFLNDVNQKMDYFNNNPLGAGPDMGLNIPGLFDNVKKAIPGDLAKYLEQQMKDLESFDPGSELLKRLKEIYKQLVEKLNEPQPFGQNPFQPSALQPSTGGLEPFFAPSEPQTGGPDPFYARGSDGQFYPAGSPSDQDGADAEGSTDSDQPARVEEFAMRYSSYMRKAVSNSILLSYAQQAPAEDKPSNTLALTA